MSDNTGALAGLRVLDLGIITAGAATSQVLADFGAEVIKVESTTYTDPFRNWSQIAGGGSADPNNSPPFATVNRGKRGIAIDLKSPAGHALFLRLVAISDVVVENFRRGVLERLGIGFEVLKKANPQIVLASLSSQGSVGPEAGYASFGSTLEAIGGLMAITGYADGAAPVWSGNNVNYPDQLVSVVSPGLILVALRARNRTGQAIHLDAPQREAVTAGIGEVVVEHSLTGQVAAPLGARHERFVPQGVYQTAGEDQWIATTVTDDAQWQHAVKVLTLPSWCADLTSAAARRGRADDIDAAFAAAVRNLKADDVAAKLQAVGVPASAVYRPREVLDHPQLAALGFPVEVNGDRIVQRGFVARLDGTPGRVKARAPRLGEHTRDVLTELLGLTDNEITALADSGAVFADQI
jgi:crotonobetainyl-CoA:carnitine CoA-transferase CaiB-like acyl-CoA transferase